MLKNIDLIEKYQVALIGNPNSGKTTLFNLLTGLNQRTGNFPGVTVDKKTGYCNISANLILEIIDLPGTYSLYPKSIDEQVTFDVITNEFLAHKSAVVIIVADSANLKRSLLLTTQIIDLQIPCVLVLNMIDVAKKNGITINQHLLSKKLGVPVIVLNSKNGTGILELKKYFQGQKATLNSAFTSNFKLLGDSLTKTIQEKFPHKTIYAGFVILLNQAKHELIKNTKGIDTLEFANTNNTDLQLIQAKDTLFRFDIISNLYKACVVEVETKKSQTKFSSRLDDLLTHKLVGLLIFAVLLFTIFQAIFNFSSLPMQWIESAFSELSSFLIQLLPVGIVSDLLVNGILAGLSGIVVFIPQIAFLFAFIVILEDTGYMARVSFMMDRLMRVFGLSGRSIIPLIGGVACAVPAIMSARTISNWKERMITIMVTPLMSCSARLPVYTLLISLTIPNIFVFGFIQLQGLVFFLLYFLGTFFALLVGLILKHTLKTKENSFFIMEMPLYKWPSFRTVFFTIVEKVKVFLFDAGKVILTISVILWFLTSFGPSGKFHEIENKYKILTSAAHADTIKLKIHEQTEKLEASFAGVIGKKIEPFIAPIGYDWKIGIALITSFAAREVFVGTMATIYSAKNGEDISSVRQMMASEINPKTGKKMYTIAVGASLLVFYAFSMQCMSTVAVVYRETKHWKWPLIQFVYMGILAYAFSFLVYTILN